MARVEGLSRWRPAQASGWERSLNGLLAFVADHWLALVNVALFVFVALPIAAPVLEAAGLHLAADTIYFLYSFTCHQLDSRSYHILGQKVAFCQRDVAIYSSALLASLSFNLMRSWARPISWRFYLLLITPMALDGFTQLFGWRESNWELRTLTGALFGASSGFLALPYLQKTFRELKSYLIANK